MKYILFLIIILQTKISLAMTTSPKVVCSWLPWCQSDVYDKTSTDRIDNKWFFDFLDNIIAEMIKYIAVIAVIALIISWIYYIISMWEKEKTSKAKRMIIWSLVWVLISTSAYFIINMLTKFNIN